MMNIHIFYCANCLDADSLRQQLQTNGNDPATDQIKAVSLPCSGKVNLLYLLKAFEKGTSGVLLVTCEHNACKFLEGNLRAQKRAAAVNSLLEEIGLGKGRMVVIQKSKEGVDQITAAIEQLKNS